MTNTNQVEDQIFEDEEQKGFLSIRNIAIIGGVTLLALTGLGVYYRNELFGSKSADAETEKPITDPVVPVPIVAPGSEDATVITFEQYKLNARHLLEIEKLRKYYTPSSISENFWALLGAPKFPLVMQCPDDQTDGKTLVGKEFTSFETLFKAYANAPDGCVMVRGIREYMFKRSDGGKFVLPIKEQGNDLSDLVVEGTFADLLEEIKDIVKDGSNSARQIDYDRLNTAFVEELPKIESRLNEEKTKFDKAYPYQLKFSLPLSVVELDKEFEQLKPMILSEKVDGKKMYMLPFKDIESYKKARLGFGL